MAWYGGTNGRTWRKTRVDECAWRLSVSEFLLTHRPVGANGPAVYRVAWSGKGEPIFSTLAAPPSWLAPRLPKDWAARVELEPCPWPVYGTRWFFRCCRCLRRCGVLYAVLPESPLVCRRCGDLTYRSAQQWDNRARTGRAAGLLGRLTGY